MKKIISYLFLFVVSEIVVYGASCENWCSEPRQFVVYGTSHPADIHCDTVTLGSGGYVSHDDCPSKFGSLDDYCYGTKKYVKSLSSSTQSLSSDTYGNSSNTFYTKKTRVVNCLTCSDPDIPYTPPEGNYTSLNLTKSSCDLNPDPDIDQQCTDLGGSFYMVEKKDCCWLAICFVENNDTVPPPVCEPPEVPQSMGGCACPADTYPVTLNGATVSCMPNTDCDPAKGQVLDSGTGVCGCLPGFFPDVNSVCLPLPTDNNDTNSTPPGCDPGQYLCYGQCQLMSVPCTPPTNPNDPTGGDGLPCEYPDSVDGLPYQSPEPTQEFCQQTFVLFGDTTANMVYKKEPDCWHGACYYLNKINTPPDNNNSNPPPLPDPTPGGNSGSITDGNDTKQLDLNLSNLTGAIDKVNASVVDNGGKLDKIDASINNQGNRIHDALTQLKFGDDAVRHQVKRSGDQISNVLNSLNNNLGSKLSNNTNAVNNVTASVNSLGDKLDAIKGAIDDKNLSVTVNVDLGQGNGTKPFKPVEANLSKFVVDKDRMDAFNDGLSKVYEGLEDAGELMENVREEYDTFFTNIKTTWTQLNVDFATYKTMFENKPTVSVPSGSCDLTASVLGTTLDLGASLCSGMQKMSPIFVFIITISSQLTLIYMGLWLIRKD